MKTLNGQHGNDASKTFKSMKLLECGIYWQASIVMNYGLKKMIFYSASSLREKCPYSELF